MRKLVFISLAFCSSYAFATCDVEVAGQFVIAPISSEKCEASAITTPTYGLPSDSELFDMLTPFLTENGDASGIKQTKTDKESLSTCSSIYDISGRRMPSLQKGLNIIIDKDGNKRKMIID